MKTYKALKKEMLKDPATRFWYYFYKPRYWIESLIIGYKIRKQIKDNTVEVSEEDYQLLLKEAKRTGKTVEKVLEEIVIKTVCSKVERAKNAHCK